MDNLFLQKVDYKVTTTRLGVWRSYLYPTGRHFAEFRSHGTLLGFPLLHYTSGICPETGRRVAATGVVAVGRMAFGFLAIGQAAFGLLAVGQLALSVFLGFGQASTGVVAFGQLAVGLRFALGQLSVGSTAIGQLGIGKYVLAQVGFGDHVWTMKRVDPEAMEYFRSFLQRAFDWW